MAETLIWVGIALCIVQSGVFSGLKMKIPCLARNTILARMREPDPDVHVRVAPGSGHRAPYLPSVTNPGQRRM